LDGQLLPAKQQAELETVVSTTSEYDYGLGIAESKLSCGKTVWNHTGGVLGYRSEWLSHGDRARERVLPDVH
jgi:D-alanyl-D-alanine carboxypeptidase